MCTFNRLAYLLKRHKKCYSAITDNLEVISRICLNQGLRQTPLTMDQGATPARKPSVSASATFSGVIPIQNGDGQATSSVAYVPVANGGETQEETFNDSPIKVKPEHFPLTDMSAELSHEDDDMLALQIVLAEIREHLITLKIEL